MGNVTAKTSGDIASFMTPAETNIKSLKVHFSPKQLGEGDPSPENVREIVGWDGVEVNGCGKNIAHIVGYSATVPASSDPSLRKLSNNYGTTISTTNFSLSDTKIIITQSSYTTKYDPVSYRNGYFAVVVDNLDFTKRYNVSFNVDDIINNPLNVDLSRIRAISPAGTGFEPPAKIDGNRLFFKNVPFTPHSNYPNRKSFEIRNAGMSFTLSEFMVTPVDDEDFEYKPYQGNIYSKEWTKNLLDIWQKPNGYKPSSNANGNYDWSKEWIVTDELKGKTITYSTFIDNTNANGNGYVHIWTKNSEGNYIKTSIIPPSNKQIIAGESGWSYVNLILTDDIYSVIFGITVSANATAKYPMVELGSEPTEYQPYIGTVYGGYVDLISGELVEEDYVFNIDSSLTCEWKGNFHEVYKVIYTLPYIGKNENAKASNIFKLRERSTAMYNYPTSGRLALGEHNKPTTRVEIGCYSNTATTEEEWLNWLEDNNSIQVLYSLATPITHQLTPTQLKSFVGQNNFWSNADYVEIEYELKETEDIQKARKKIILNQPHIESIKNDSISFTTDMKAPLKECKVSFMPVQEGEGDPSPENVRNITGWNRVEVKNGDNIYSIDWINDVGTVYGGYVDLVKGELVSDMAMVEFDGSSDENWQVETLSSGLTNYYMYATSLVPKARGKQRTDGYICSNMCIPRGENETYISGMFYFSNSGALNVYLGGKSNTSTVAEFKSWLTEHKLQVAYWLAEPIHYSLTPQQILSLKGINNFSCGIKNDLSVRYWNYKKSNSSNIAYEAKNLTFDGTNYIDTGVYLFSEKNINRDFEVVVEGINGSDTSSNTIICAKHNGKSYGFLVRLNGASYINYNGTISLKQNYDNFLIVRRINGVISISGDKITNPNVKFTNAVFNHPLVIGCAVDDDGTYYRHGHGTIQHIVVRWL